MAQHAVLTKKSNQRIAAAVAVSGLVGTGLAVPFAQVSLANGVDVDGTCTITSDGASQATLRSEIDAAIANTSCEVIVINNTVDEPLSVLVEGSRIYVGPSNEGADTRTSITIKSTTGLNIAPAAGFTGSLMMLQDQASWTLSGPCSSISSYVDCTVESGANTFTKITIEGLSLRDSAISAIEGLYFGNDATDATLEIKNSRFVGNNLSELASEDGGAVNTAADIVVSNSTFLGNYALTKGGAIRTHGTASISNSLFLSNRSDADGGAVYAGAQTGQGQLPGNIYAVNSSFVRNLAGNRAGALFTYLGETELVLNTFFSNNANMNNPNNPTLSPYSQEAVFGDATTKLWGNIFANDSWTYSEVDDLSEDLGHNVFMDLSEMQLSNNASRTANLDQLAFEYDLRTESGGIAFEDELIPHAFTSSPITTTPALRITSSSVAAGFVTGSFPDADFNDFFNNKISADQVGNPRTLPFDAGAHQVRYLQPVVRDRTTYEAPVAAPLTPKEALVPGFAANSTKLTKPMKKEIRELLKASPDLKNVVCKGYTSSPSTAQDRVLARQRGKAACDYIKTLRPDVKVTIQSGSHTNKPGSQIRRVSIKLS